MRETLDAEATKLQRLQMIYLNVPAYLMPLGHQTSLRATAYAYSKAKYPRARPKQRSRDTEQTASVEYTGLFVRVVAAVVN